MHEQALLVHLAPGEISHDGNGVYVFMMGIGPELSESCGAVCQAAAAPY